MKKSLIAIVAALLIASPVYADLELPRPSPFAHVTQSIGLTDITVDYSSPGVGGRPIWGALVPYDKIWRTGANLATKITFTKDVLVGDKPVPAGSYAIFTIPGKTAWTVILNKNFNQGGTGGYKEELDVARIQVTPTVAPSRERLAFLFADFDNEAAQLQMEWEKLRISIPIKVKTQEQALAGIKALGESGWRQYANAARYLLEHKDYDGGLPLVEKSLVLKEDWLNVFTKAQLLAGKNRYKDALPLAEKAQALGAKSENFFLAEDVKKALVEWKGKK